MRSFSILPKLRLWSLVVLLSTGVKVAAGPSEPSPNFVFILVDDMAADAIGIHGKYPFLQTPNLDRMAREGVEFANAFVGTSLCSPSRASILTGVHAHVHGVVDNSGQRDPAANLPLYPELLQRRGYETAHIGKWHMAEGDQPRRGFSHWFGFDGQGVYFDGVINRNGEAVVRPGYVTDVLTDDAVDFIKANADRPFALNLWHKALHEPFLPPPRHSVPAHREFPEPHTWSNDLADKPVGLRRTLTYGAHYRAWVASEGKVVPDHLDPVPFNAEASEWYRRHLSTLRAVDESLGRIFAVLESAGILDRTMVVFAADNGFFMGEFRLRDKRLAYDPSMRIPLLMRYPPAGRGVTEDALVSALDLAPTFLDYAGAEVPAHLQGHSLRPMLDGWADAVRTDLFYEYFQEEFAPGKPTILGLRTARWKLIRYPYEDASAYTDELFDLQADPEEIQNLAADPTHAVVLRDLRFRLAQRARELDFEAPPYRYEAPTPMAMAGQP